MSASNRPFRLDGLDAARGVAIALMFLSHTVKSLLWFKMIPDWGIVPVHAVTKFSSALFIIVFGATLAVVYLPKVGTTAWPKARMAMWKRGLLIMFWYKVLTVVQMFQNSPPKAIWEVLSWQRFPDFVEILQFYGWFMLLLPLLLPLWGFLPLFGRLGLVAVMAAVTNALQHHFDFWGIWQLKAVLVEDERAFCFGVLSRGSMALGALWLAELFLSDRGDRERQSVYLALTSLVLGGLALAGFYRMHATDLMEQLFALAKNEGKHPPTLDFILYANGGALILLGLMLLARGPFAWLVKPFQIIGRESLLCFNLHIIVIFVVYRYAFDLRHHVTYPQALVLTAVVFAVAIMAAWLNTARKGGGRGRSERHEAPPAERPWMPPHDAWWLKEERRPT